MTVKTGARGRQNPHPWKKENTQPLRCGEAEVFLFLFGSLFLFLSEGGGLGVVFSFFLLFLLAVALLLPPDGEKRPV
jgi:hypothetical protein